jgi:hypothetical protein
MAANISEDPASSIIRVKVNVEAVDSAERFVTSQ